MNDVSIGKIIIKKIFEEEYEKEMFRPVLEESESMNRKLETIFKESTDLDNEITAAANKGHYDLLLISLKESIYEGSLLGRLLGFTTRIINPETLLNTVTGKENIFETLPFDEHTRQVVFKSQVPVGIFVDKGFSDFDQVFIPILEEQDVFLIDYAQKLIHNAGAQVTITDISGILKVNDAARERIRSIEQKAPNHIALNSNAVITSESLKGRNLMLIGLNSWRVLIESKSDWLSDIPSTLVISDKPE